MARAGWEGGEVTQYRYSRPDTMGEGEFHSFSSVWDENSARFLAEDAAEDYHKNNDGWDAHWPIQLRIMSDSGDEIGIFTVESEAQPSFYATRL